MTVTSPLTFNHGVRWLASYPKSGNTWVRFLLYQYFFGEARSSLDIARYIPGIHNRKQVAGAQLFDGAMFVKSHYPLGPQTPSHERALSCVYVVRHPRDVVLSCLNYARMVPYMPETVTDETYVRTFIAKGGALEYLAMQFGTLEDHYKSWLDQTKIPTLLVRYEDLKADAGKQLERMVSFLGYTPDPARVEGAVKLSSFERLKAMEVEEKSSNSENRLFVGSPEQMHKGRMFMNKGQSGRSLESIAKGLDAAVEARFADMLRRFGYAGR